MNGRRPAFPHAEMTHAPLPGRTTRAELQWVSNWSASCLRRFAPWKCSWGKKKWGTHTQKKKITKRVRCNSISPSPLCHFFVRLRYFCYWILATPFFRRRLDIASRRGRAVATGPNTAPQWRRRVVVLIVGFRFFLGLMGDGGGGKKTTHADDERKKNTLNATRRTRNGCNDGWDHRRGAGWANESANATGSEAAAGGAEAIASSAANAGGIFNNKKQTNHQTISHKTVSMSDSVCNERKT